MIVKFMKKAVLIILKWHASAFVDITDHLSRLGINDLIKHKLMRQKHRMQKEKITTG